MRQRVIFVGKGLITLALILLIVGVSLALFPAPVYEANARISVEPEPVDITRCGAFPYSRNVDVSFIESSMEELRSNAVLFDVIDTLGLCEKWKRAAQPLSREQVIEQLKDSLRISRIEGTSIIVLGVRRSSPAEAAEVANIIAEVYRKRDLDTEIEVVRNHFDAMETKIKSQLFRMEAAEETVQKIQDQLLFFETYATAGTDGSMTFQHAEEKRASALKSVLEVQDGLKLLGEQDGQNMMEPGASIPLDQVYANINLRIQHSNEQLLSLNGVCGQKSHPEDQHLAEQIDKKRAQLSELAIEYQIAKNELESWDQILAQWRASRNEKKRELYPIFERAKDKFEKEHKAHNELMLEHRIEVSIQDVPRSRVTVVKIAKSDSYLVRPKRIQMVVISSALAALVAISGAVILATGQSKFP